jgi:hypothetical protein
MPKSTFPKIPFLFSILFFALSVTAFIFFYRTIEDKQGEFQTQEKKWVAETERRNEIKALDRSVKMVEGERARLATHFAKSSDAVPFLDTIEALAPRVGAKAEVTSVEIAENRAGLLVGMKASGSFESLHKFITLLENSPYELEFMGVDINKETSESARGSWEAVFRIRLVSFIE